MSCLYEKINVSENTEKSIKFVLCIILVDSQSNTTSYNILLLAAGHIYLESHVVECSMESIMHTDFRR